MGKNWPDPALLHQSFKTNILYVLKNRQKVHTTKGQGQLLLKFCVKIPVEKYIRIP